jgi:hypothetical protein
MSSTGLSELQRSTSVEICNAIQVTFILLGHPVYELANCMEAGFSSEHGLRLTVIISKPRPSPQLHIPKKKAHHLFLLSKPFSIYKVEKGYVYKKQNRVIKK